MALNGRDLSAATPVPVREPVNTVRQGFHQQSYEKSVGAVATLFGCEPMAVIGERAVPAEEQWCKAISSSMPGQPLRRWPETTGPKPAASTRQLLAAGLESVKVRRIVGVDRYVLHRAYPSPRGMFGVDLELVDSAGSRRVEPWGPYTTEVFGTGTERRNSAVRPVLHLLSKPERFPLAYGSLRPSLALLEAGHLLATVGTAIFQSGLDTEVGFGRLPQAGPADAVESVAWAGSCTKKSRPTLNDASEASIGSPEHEHLVRLASGCLEPDLAAPPTFEDWLNLRSSGSSHANLVTSGSIGESVEAATDALVSAALAAASHLLPSPNAMLVHKVKLEGNEMDSKMATECGPTGFVGVTRPIDGIATAPFSSSLGYCWSVDFQAWENRYGTNAETVLHTLLGWLCQWVCLGAAARETTARPARNFDEAEWGQALGLGMNHVPVYQVWLRPAPRTEYVEGIWTTFGRKAGA